MIRRAKSKPFCTLDGSWILAKPMTDRLYFDWNATAPLRPEARAAMIAALGWTGNASSVHAEGRAARAPLSKRRAARSPPWSAPRRRMSPSRRARPKPTCWRSLRILRPARDKAPRDRLFVARSSIRRCAAAAGSPPSDVEEVPVDSDGIVDLGDSDGVSLGAERPLVSVMLANNETGVIQPVLRIAEIVHAANGLLHVDAVQAPGRIALRHRRARRRSDDAVGAQDRRSAGRRRADPPRRPAHFRAADQAAAGRSAAFAAEPKTLPALAGSARPLTVGCGARRCCPHGGLARSVGNGAQVCERQAR